MATGAQDISRFCITYQKFLILIAIVFAIHIFLAVRVVILPGGWETVSGDGAKGPYYSNKKQSSQKEIDEGQPEKVNSEAAYVNALNQGAPHILKKNAAPHNSSLVPLDLESLDFVPECNITSKDSISAINRAKTQYCKEEIASLSCKIISDTIYAKRLPRLCKNPEKTYGRHKGCYKDSPKSRLLTGYLSLLKENNSPLSCVDLCLQSGFQYAGLQYGVECFCGNKEPGENYKIDESECNIKCPEGNDMSKEVMDQANLESWGGHCGGYYALDLFETGVFQEYETNKNIVDLEGRKDGLLVDPPVKTVRIVFFLTLNGRSVRQVYRLIKALFLEKHFFYIHIDSRQDYLYRELLSLERTIPNNVRFMKSRMATIWGGASLLTVLLAGMQDLISNAKTWDWDWDYVINLSESDFPLKTTEKLEEFLSHNNGRNFVKSHGRDVQKFIQKQGLDKTFFECENRMWRVADRKLPKGVMIDGGSDWIALHRNFVDYVIKTDDELVSGLKVVFKYTLLPAESFFHTVLRNSIHCQTFVDNNLHVTNWKRKLGCKCQYRNVVDWCGCSPNDFRLSDWNRLLLAENKILFFGRKFEAIINQGIINKLESWLYPGRFETHYPTMDRFWLSLFHHHDMSPKPDDALVTLGRSLSRIAARKFANKYNCTIATANENTADNAPVKLIEVTAHNHDDQFEGVLVRFDVDVTKPNGYQGSPETFTLSLESWFQIETRVTVVPWNANIAKYRSKVKDLDVGLDYDQKEQKFRNFARSIGPFSEPVLVYNVLSDEPFNITAVFVDPSGNIQAVVNGSSGDGTGAPLNFIKPNLKIPLLPGRWNIKILTLDGYLLAEVQMPVLPLEIYMGKPLSQANMQHINVKDIDPISDFNGHSLPESDNVQKIADLQIWIDDLVEEFYTLQDFCLEHEQNHLLLSTWKVEDLRNSQGSQSHTDRYNRKFDHIDIIETSLCSHVQWSSLFPDPKSTITNVDPETGRLLP